MTLVAISAIALAGAALFAMPALARTDTALDRSFADRGTFHAPKGSLTSGYPGNRLVVVGGGPGGISVARYLPDGRPDPAFGGGDGNTIASRAAPYGNYFWTAAAVKVSRAGDIFIVGYLERVLGPEAEGGYHPHQTVVARLMPDGALAWITGEATGESGAEGPRLSRDISGATVETIAIQGQKILLGGLVGDPYSDEAHGFMARLDGEGTPDRTFAGGASFTLIPPGPRGKGRSRFTGFSTVNSLLAVSGGPIYATGSLRSGLMVTRLTRDGRLDPAFGQGGIARDGVGRRYIREGWGLARDPKGRLLVSGAGQSDFAALARFDRKGRWDRSFGRAGVVRTRVGDGTFGRGLAVEADGRILVACVVTHRGSPPSGGDRDSLGLIGYRPDGRLDPTFFGDGIFFQPVGSGWFESSSPWAPTLGANGRILLAGGDAAMRFRRAR